MDSKDYAVNGCAGIGNNGQGYDMCIYVSRTWLRPNQDLSDYIFDADT